MMCSMMSFRQSSRNAPVISNSQSALFMISTIIIFLLLCPISISGLTAKVTYSAPKTTDGQLPDELNVTVTSTTDNTVTVLHLVRIKEADQEIPVYTIAVDESGVLRMHEVDVENSKNSAIYEDVPHEAILQVTKDSMNNGHLILEGELNFGGHQYRLTPELRRKRSAVSSLSDTYLLKPQKLAAAARNDYIGAPPERRVSVEQTDTETLMPHISVVSSSKGFSFSSSHSSSNNSASPSRQKRQTSFYYIDNVAVIDYGIYSRFLSSASDKSTAIYNIREYFAFIFRGVDLRYQNIQTLDPGIRVRITKIIIAEEASASSFTENFRQADTPWDEVDAEQALNAFSDFAVTTGSDILTPYDHAMLFTGYDLTSAFSNTPRTNSTTGLAYTSTLCRTDGKSVSVVEDLGGFQSVDTAAHELGHSLSASHDGEGNGCRSSDRYIMAGGSSPETSQNRLNPWHFSSCSINYFNNFLSTTIRTSRGQTCLNLALPINPSVPNVDDQLPGLKYSPDEQCRMIYGSASRLCRGTEFGVASDVCTSMFCYDPSTTGTCYEQTAARGTVCGNGKICLNGGCVTDSRAPAVDDDCVFGDQPGIAFENQSCEDFVNGFTGYCYQAVVRGRCCASCKSVYRMVTDCEYGNTLLGCQSEACPFATDDYKSKCCGSCNYGTTFTTTGQTQPTSISTTGTTTRTTGTTRTTPTPVPTTRTTPATNQCQDDSQIRINGQACAEAIQGSPQFCYQASVQQFCCQSCQSINSSIPGCEFGDLYPVSCSQLTTCLGFETNCCSTCSGNNPTVRTSSTTTLSTSSSTPATTEAPCLDEPDIRVNGLTCQIAVRQSPNFCYSLQVKDVCCLSCRRSNTGKEGCEYGDLNATFCAQPAACSNSRGDVECCSTCSTAGSDSIQSKRYLIDQCFYLLLTLVAWRFNIHINSIFSR